MSGGGQITLASPAVAVEDASGTAAGRAVIPPGNLATLAQLVWSGTVGTKPLQIFAAAGNPLTLALASVSVQTAAGQTTVTASGLATTDLLLVGADTGTAAVAVPSDGLAQVSLGGAPTAVYVFTVSLADGRASPCHVIAVP